MRFNCSASGSTKYLDRRNPTENVINNNRFVHTNLCIILVQIISFRSSRYRWFSPGFLLYDANKFSTAFICSYPTAYLSDSWFPFYGSIYLLSRLLPFCSLTTLSSPGVCLFLLLEFSFILISSRFLMLFPTDYFDMTILYKPIFGLGGGIRHKYSQVF